MAVVRDRWLRINCLLLQATRRIADDHVFGVDSSTFLCVFGEPNSLLGDIRTRCARLGLQSRDALPRLTRLLTATMTYQLTGEADLKRLSSARKEMSETKGLVLKLDSS